MGASNSVTFSLHAWVLCLCYNVLRFLVLSFSGFCLSVFMYVLVCIYLCFLFYGFQVSISVYLGMYLCVHTWVFGFMVFRFLS